jgi:amino acid transporter
MTGSGGDGNRLQANSVGVVGVIATSFGAMAPTIGIALGVQLVATQAGAATPLAFVLTTVGSLAVAYAFIVFSRRVASSGVAFTYLGAAFGKVAGFVGGFLHAGGWVTVVATTCGVASLSFSALLAQASIQISWFPIYVVLVAAAFAVCFLGIRPSTRLMLIIELASMLTLAVVAVVVIAKGGAAGLTLTPFNPGASLKGIGGLGFALIFAFGAFLGYEASASLGLESANPRRTVPVAILSAVVLGGLFFVLVSYAVTIGYGVSQAAAFAGDSTPIDTVTTRYAGHAAASLVDAMIAVSGFGSAIAAMNLSARVFYNVSRSGMAPEWLGRVHPRFKTPHIGLVIDAIIGLAIGAFIGLPAGATTMIGLVAGSNTIAIEIAYAGVAAAAVWMFGRGAMSVGRRLVTVGIPVVGMAVIAFAIYSGVYPPPAFPFNLTVPIAAVWLIIVIVLAVRQKDRGVAPVLDAEVSPA